MVLMRSNILLLLFCFSFYLAPQYAVAEELNSDSLTIVDLKELGIQFAGNNKIQLITSGAEKFDLMFNEIEQAQKYVYLEYFNFRNDSIGNVLFDLLCKKANEGVVVRIIFDDWGNRSNDKPLKKEHIQRLRDAGIEIHKFDPLVFPWINHAFHRDHRKIVIIDGLVLYTGGMNVADYYIHGKPEFGKWRDMHMRLEGDAVSLYRNIFLKMWDRCSDVSIDSLEYIAHGDSVDRIFEYDTTAIYVGVANR